VSPNMPTWTETWRRIHDQFGVIAFPGSAMHEQKNYLCMPLTWWKNLHHEYDSSVNPVCMHCDMSHVRHSSHPGPGWIDPLTVFGSSVPIAKWCATAAAICWLLDFLAVGAYNWSFPWLVVYHSILVLVHLIVTCTYTCYVCMYIYIHMEVS
jgi:hypothetical protein